MASAVLILSLLGIFLPKAEFSLWERRRLAELPKLTMSSLLDGSYMSAFEKYAPDAFPLRDSFRMLKSVFDRSILGKWDKNGVYLKNGYAAAMEYPLNTESIRRASEKFRFIYERYLTEENRIYLSVIPDKNYFLAPESGRLSLDYRLLTDTLREDMPYARYIDIFPHLTLEDYYKTDTHWRQEKLLPAANAILSAMGKEQLAEFRENTLDIPFYGVYRGQLALPMKSERIVYLTDGRDYTVYDYENSREIGMYDMEKAQGNDPYEMFLSGSLSLIKIKNNDPDSQGRLIIFRDSFGSSIAPILAPSYSEVVLVDIRYIRSDFLGAFVDFSDADILFLYSTLVLNNSDTFK
ncbi:MAG: hypothetical protein IJ389_01410 [Clostridia bacterium]|nr:hypothetical protein [Clostridia bacterium]